MTETAKFLFQEGRLTDAIKAMNGEVKASPADMNRRGFLAELLCFDRNVERADLMLDAMVKQDPSVAVGVALFRQQVRGELARQEFFQSGRLPEFLSEPPEHVLLQLQASIALREGKLEEAAKLLAQAEEVRPKVSGTMGDEAFDDMRDLDDRIGGVFETITSTGKYYWVPMERVESIEFRPAERPRDLIWRAAHMIVKEGPDGEVYIPAIYMPPAGADPDERTRLGRVTDWIGAEGEPVRGMGQRSFLVGEHQKSIMELEFIQFDNPVGA